MKKEEEVVAAAARSLGLAGKDQGHSLGMVFVKGAF